MFDCPLYVCVDKVLKEMIEPYNHRVHRLQEFLNDVKPSLKYEIVPLSDPFGPSVSDPELQCIVVSEETRRGGEAVNRKRVENVSHTAYINISASTCIVHLL